MTMPRYLSCCANLYCGAVILLTGAMVSAPVWAQDRPFGGQQDPSPEVEDEAASGDDPFGPPRKAEEDRRQRELAARNAEAARVCRMAEWFIEKMLTSEDPYTLLDATLSRLNSTTAVPNSLGNVGLLEKLLRLPWPRQAGDTPADVATRVLQQQARSDHSLSRQLKDYRAQYRSLRGEPATFDWPAAGDHWGKVFAEALAAADADHLPNHIRARIKSKLLNDDLMRSIYLAALRVRHRPWDAEKTWDFELVRPWTHATNDYSFLALHRTAEVLTSLIAARAPADHPDRVRLEKQLWAYLVDPDCTAEHVCQDDGPLGRLWRLDRRLGHKIASILLTRHGSAWWHFVQTARIEPQQAEDLFWGHEIVFDVKHLPLKDAVARIGGKRLWVDSQTAADDSHVTLQTTAPRTEVLKAVLAGTDCEVVRFPHGIVWVGPKNRRAVAEQELHDALKRVPLGDSPVRRALAAITDIEFIETPLNDLGDYLSDVHGVEVVVSHEVSRRPITQKLKHMPLLLALTLLTEATDLRWTTAESIIFVGEPESIDELDRLYEWWQHRRIRLRELELGGSELAAEMFRPTTLEFIETPLPDVCDYLSDLHSHRHVVLSPARDDTPMTANLTGHGLGWTLTLMLWRVGLTWETDGEIVVIGHDSDLARYLKLSDTRPQRRSAYPEKLADKLQAKHNMPDFEWPLHLFCQELSHYSGITIQPSKKALRLDRRITLDVGQYPFDVGLDLISHRHGLIWEIQGSQIVIKPASPQSNTPKNPFGRKTNSGKGGMFVPRR